MRLCVGCFEDRLISLVQSHFHKMYTVEYAKTGRAGCKLCTGKIGKGELRIGKQVSMTPCSHSSNPLLPDSGGEGRLLGHRDRLVSFPLLLGPGAPV